MSVADKIFRALRMLVDRTLLVRISYKGNIRVLQVSSRPGVVQDGLEHMEPAGFSSHPLPGAEAIVNNPGGNSGRALVIMANDRRYRIPLEEGETVIYNMPHGDRIHIKKDRSILIKSALKVIVDTPNAEFTGAVKMKSLAVDEDATVSGKSVLHHFHNEHDGPPTSEMR